SNIVSEVVEKERKLRYQSVTEMRTDLERLKRDSESGKTAVAAGGGKRGWVGAGIAIAAVVVAAGVAGSILYLRNTGQAQKDAGKWEQIPFFTDSAVYPALSPD